MPNKAFLEITNICNLSCSFCPGTSRSKRFMTEPEFRLAAGKLRSFAAYLYFHVMGEPLLHPLLGRFLTIAGELGFRVILTTNGTLLPHVEETLLSASSLHKISISLHSLESNENRMSMDTYLTGCFSFCEKAAERGIISVLRLWNLGGRDSFNPMILQSMHEYFDVSDSRAAPSSSLHSPWQPMYSGYKIREKIFLEWGEKFDWPDIDGAFLENRHSCRGLSDQIGVLCDGTVIPCCLDADGNIALGNIFTASLDDILHSPRAEALRRSLNNHCIQEPLCCRCGYAVMRSKK